MMLCALSEKWSEVESNCKASLLPSHPSSDQALWPLAKQPRAWNCATSLHLSPHQSSRLLIRVLQFPKGLWTWGKECLVMNYTTDQKIENTTQKYAIWPRQTYMELPQKIIIIIISPPNLEIISQMLNHERDPQNLSQVSYSASGTEV